MEGPEGLADDGGGAVDDDDDGAMLGGGADGQPVVLRRPVGAGLVARHWDTPSLEVGRPDFGERVFGMAVGARAEVF